MRECDPPPDLPSNTALDKYMSFMGNLFAYLVVFLGVTLFVVLGSGLVALCAKWVVSWFS